jgi:nucleoside-diphosphate-sugar epimerase
MMKNKQKRFGIRAIMALVAAVFMVGCYTKSDAPYDPNVSGKDPVYTATITVLDAASKAGVTGVTFNGITATGGTNGVYTFTPTTAGTYTFVVSKEGYEEMYQIGYDAVRDSLDEIIEKLYK